MEEPWLDEDASGDWLEAAGPNGEVLGYIQRREAHLLGLPVRRVEVPKRYLEDPYVRNHAVLAHARGIFTSGEDLNDVQVVLLAGEITKHREVEEALRVRLFEESMLISNPTLFTEYKEKKDREAGVQVGLGLVEERGPESIEEFWAHLSAFSEEDEPGSSKDREKAEGWLSGLLNSDDLDQMDD